MPPVHSPVDAALTQIPVIRRESVIAGSRTAWWEYGPASEAAAATIVLVHGFRGTHHGLLSLVAHMPDVRFIAPDLPGFGESSRFPVPQSLDAYSAWLEAFLGEVDAQSRAIVLGHSFGSLVVARRISACGDRRIVLVNPIAAPALEGPSALLTQLAVFYYWLGATLPAPIGHAILSNRVITRVMSEVMAKTKHRGLRAWIHDQHDRYFSSFTDRTALLEAFRASTSDSVLAHARELPADTLLIAGERDDIAPVAAQRALAEAAGLDLHVIAGVGHLIHYETPVSLARVLREGLLVDALPAEERA